MPWRFVDAGKVNSSYSIGLFESIAKHLANGKVEETILFWQVSSPTIFLGYHQCVDDEVDIEYCKANSIEIVRRTLGGGCGFSDENQILYAIIGLEGTSMPYNTQRAYEFVLKGVVIALESFGLDAYIEKERNAVYIGDRKISGNAQGRENGVVMVNGSLLLDFDFTRMENALKNPTKNLRPGVKRARDGMTTLKELFKYKKIDVSQVKVALRDSFQKAMGITTYDGALTDSERKLAIDLGRKFSQTEWTYRIDRKRVRRWSNGDS